MHFPALFLRQRTPSNVSKTIKLPLGNGRPRLDRFQANVTNAQPGFSALWELPGTLSAFVLLCSHHFSYLSPFTVPWLYSTIHGCVVGSAENFSLFPSPVQWLSKDRAAGRGKQIRLNFLLREYFRPVLPPVMDSFVARTYLNKCCYRVRTVFRPSSECFFFR